MTWAQKPAPLPAANLNVHRGMSFDQLSWSTARDRSGADYLLYNVYASEQWPVDVSDARNLVAARCRQQSVTIPNKGRSLHYAVTATDRYGNESAPKSVQDIGRKPQRKIDFRQLIVGNSVKSYKKKK